MLTTSFLMFSADQLPDFQCFGRLLTHPRRDVCGQAIGSDPDSSADHSIHAVRWVLREPGQHPMVLDSIPVPVNLQVRVPGTRVE